MPWVLLAAWFAPAGALVFSGRLSGRDVSLDESVCAALGGPLWLFLWALPGWIGAAARRRRLAVPQARMLSRKDRRGEDPEP